MSGLPGVQRRAQVEEKMRGNRKTNARAGHTAKPNAGRENGAGASQKRPSAQTPCSTPRPVGGIFLPKQNRKSEAESQ